MSENMTIARPYAKAIFHVAFNSKLLDEWDKVLSFLSMFINDNLFNRFLSDKTVFQDKKVDIVLDLLKSCDCYSDSFGKKMSNFIKVLSLHGRLMYVKDIYFLYRSYMNTKLECVEAVIKVAYPFGEEQKEHIIAYLSKRFNKQILASFVVDDGLLGGFLVKIDDFVLDASVYGNLVLLRTKIMAYTR